MWNIYLCDCALLTTAFLTLLLQNLRKQKHQGKRPKIRVT